MNPTVAIVGSHKDTRHLAPWDDHHIDIWAFNEAAQGDWCKRVDAVFQMHVPAVYKNPYNRTGFDHWNWLQRTHPFPIYMHHADLQIPSCKVYPLDSIMGVLHPDKIFTSTACYALALAAYLDYERVQLFGIEASFGNEYDEQRDGIAYWVGFLRGRGAIVEKYCAGGLFDRPLYGQEELWKQDPSDYLTRITQYNKKIKGIRREMQSLPIDSDEFLNAVRAIGILEGHKAEAERYLQKVRAMIKVSGDAFLDKTELMRAQKDLLPKIDALRQEAARLKGAKDLHGYKIAIHDAAMLAGRWNENNEMLKVAP